MGTIKAKPTWHHFEGKINWLGVWDPKKRAQWRACDLENQDAT